MCLQSGAFCYHNDGVHAITFKVEVWKLWLLGHTRDQGMTPKFPSDNWITFPKTINTIYSVGSKIIYSVESDIMKVAYAKAKRVWESFPFFFFFSFILFYTLGLQIGMIYNLSPFNDINLGYLQIFVIPCHSHTILYF